jgi:hypothetical protein
MKEIIEQQFELQDRDAKTMPSLSLAFLGDSVYELVIRTVLMAIRYTATPLIIAQVIFSLIKKARWFVFIPAAVLAIIDIISIFGIIKA